MHISLSVRQFCSFVYACAYVREQKYIHERVCTLGCAYVDVRSVYGFLHMQMCIIVCVYVVQQASRRHKRTIMASPQGGPSSSLFSVYSSFFSRMQKHEGEQQQSRYPLRSNSLYGSSLLPLQRPAARLDHTSLGESTWAAMTLQHPSQNPSSTCTTTTLCG